MQTYNSPKFQNLQIQSFKGEYYYEKLAIVDDYLIIKDNIIHIYEIDLLNKNTSYHSHLDIQYELEDIIILDVNNVYFKFNNSSIIRYDIKLKKTVDVKFYTNNNYQLNNINSIYFDPNNKILRNDKYDYFGFISKNSQELYITDEVKKDENIHKIYCTRILNFNYKIIHVTFKKYELMGKEYFIIIVLTHINGYCITFSNDKINNDYTKFTKEIINKSNCNSLYKYDENAYNDYFYHSIQFDPNSNLPLAIIVINHTLKLKLCLFDKKENKFSCKEIDFNNEKSNFGDKIKIKDDIVGIHISYNTIYINFKKGIFMYDLVSCKFVDNFYSDSLIFKGLYDFKKDNFHYIFFLTNTKVLFKILEDKKYRHIKFGEDIILSNNEIYDHWFECNLCKSKTNKRCSACKKIFYCSLECQKNDWNSHKKECVFNIQKDEVNEIVEKCIVYKPDIWNEERHKIVSFYSLGDAKSITKGINLNYDIIKSNRDKNKRNQFSDIESTKPINNINADHYNNLVKLYKICEDYVCNILLLVYGFVMKKNKTDAWRLLNKLRSEMKEQLSCDKLLNIFVESIKTKPENNTNDESKKKSIIELKSYFIRFLNLYTSIAKMYYLIGEFKVYETLILEYVDKIEKLFQFNDTYIIAQAYILLGNLYVESNYYLKAITLYHESIKILSTPENSNYTGLLVSAYYNLGILYYISDQYANSRSKLEKALRFNKENSNGESYQIKAVILETLGEIEIEYKNFQAAYDYLKKAIHIRENFNLYDKKIKMKVYIFLDYIYQCLDKEFDQKKAKGKGQDIINIRTEREFDDLFNFIKLENDMIIDSNTNNEDKRNKAKFDVEKEEMEKFFLFITKLSENQIDILNKTQGDIRKNMKLPIFFSAEFKNSLTYSLRLQLSNLKILSLRRNKILKDVFGKIDVENLNYEILNSNNTQNNLSSLKNYFIASKILHNWQTTKKKENIPTNNAKRYGKTTSINNASNEYKFKGNSDDNIDKTNNYNISEARKRDVNFDYFKNLLVDYCRKYDPVKESLIDDDILHQILQAFDKNEIIEMEQNPDYLLEAIESYKKGVVYSDDEIEEEIKEDVISEKSYQITEEEVEKDKEELDIKKEKI